MSRRSYHEIGAFMSYGQACTVVDQFDSQQIDAFPMLAELVAEFRAIRDAAAAEIREISALHVARSLGDCGETDACNAASEPVSVN